MSDSATPPPVTIEELLEHGRWVRRLAASLVVGDEAADELTQASMVQAITHPPQHAGNLKAWLAVVTRNLARSRGKSDRRRAEHVRLAVEGRADVTESGDVIVTRLETQRLVSEVLLGLEPGLRDLLVLRFYDELSYREMGERMGLPTETARSRTARGLAELRTRLDERGGETAIDWRTGLVMWIGSGNLGRTGAGGGSVAVAQGLSALQVAALTLLMGLTAVLWWAPWSTRAQPVDPSSSLALETPEEARENLIVEEHPTGARRAEVRTVPGTESGELVQIAGRVVSFPAGDAIPGARVRLSRSPTRGPHLALETTTDAAGFFAFDGLLEPWTRKPEDQGTRIDSQFVLRVEKLGFASMEESYWRSALTTGSPSSGALDGDLGDLSLARALAVRTVLHGPWAQTGGLWIGAVGPGEDLPAHLRRIGTWGEDREPTWSDTLGPYIHRAAQPLLVAWDGEGIGFANLDLQVDAQLDHDILLEREPLGSVEVTLHDLAGKPVEGVELIATPLFWPMRSQGYRKLCMHGKTSRPPGWDEVRRAVTDERGIANFPALPANDGTREVDAAAGTGLRAFGSYVFCSGSRGAAGTALDRVQHSVSAPLLVRADEDNKLRILHDSRARVDIVGLVVNEHGTAIPGVTVCAVDRPYTNSRFGGGVREEQLTRTDASGRFELLDVDRHGQGLETISVIGDEIGRVRFLFDVTVPSNGQVELEIVLPRAHLLQGGLVDRAGQTVHRDDLAVVVRPAGLDPLRVAPMSDHRCDVASNGTFEWGQIPGGTWMVYPLDFESRGLVPFDPVFFEIPGERLEIVVEPFDENSTRVEFTVQGIVAGAPATISRAVAVLERPGLRAPLVIDGQVGVGTNRSTWDALPPGDWRIHLRLRGGGQLWSPLHLDGSTPVLVEEFVLRNPGSLVGTLESGVSGVLFATATLEARLLGPSWVGAGPDVESRFAVAGTRAVVDGEGRFHFDELSPGRYELRWVIGENSGLGWALVEPDSRTRVTLSVKPGRLLQLHGDLQPYLDQGLRLRVSVRNEDGHWTLWPHTSGEGGVSALLPAAALEWDACWWTTSLPGRQQAVPLRGRTGGVLTSDEIGPLEAKLPR